MNLRTLTNVVAAYEICKSAFAGRDHHPDLELVIWLTAR